MEYRTKLTEAGTQMAWDIRPQLEITFLQHLIYKKEITKYFRILFVIWFPSHTSQINNIFIIT